VTMGAAPARTASALSPSVGRHLPSLWVAALSPLAARKGARAADEVGRSTSSAELGKMMAGGGAPTTPPPMGGLCRARRRSCASLAVSGGHVGAPSAPTVGAMATGHRTARGERTPPGGAQGPAHSSRAHGCRRISRQRRLPLAPKPKVEEPKSGTNMSLVERREGKGQNGPFS
jgi:hypothetical protein